MSTYEYIDLAENAQNSASKYQVFTFDIVNSKKMSKEVRCDATDKMEELMFMIYNQIKEIEQLQNKKILLTEDVVSYQERNLVMKKFGLLYEPFMFADKFGFTVYTGSITEDEVLTIYEDCKYKLGIDFSFHTNNLYYQTNAYSLGGKEFFRGYAIDICSCLNKPLYCKVKKKLLKYK